MAKDETVVYRMGDAERDAPFEYDYPHLYYRMCQLRDAIIGYYTVQNIHAIVSTEFNATGIPYISEVEFPPQKGKRYCERMERYFAKIPKDNAVLPRPQFAVNVTVEYGEDLFERYVFDFKTYGDETVTEFCRKICNRALYYFRSRAAYRFRKVASSQK